VGISFGALGFRGLGSLDSYCFMKKQAHMKKIEAVVRLSRFEKIRDGLAQIGVKFFTLQEVKGYGLQKREKLVYRGSVYDADYIARLQIDILTTEDMVEPIITAIVSAGRTGEIGDGKIAVYDVEQVVRIRTSEKGQEAI
jgi:nitrogen regulatory protein PII